MWGYKHNTQHSCSPNCGERLVEQVGGVGFRCLKAQRVSVSCNLLPVCSLPVLSHQTLKGRECFFCCIHRDPRCLCHTTTTLDRCSSTAAGQYSGRALLQCSVPVQWNTQSGVTTVCYSVTVQCSWVASDWSAGSLCDGMLNNESP